MPGFNRSFFRDLGDPALLGVPRRPNEGRRQLFDRDEIRQAEKLDEEQVLNAPFFMSLVKSDKLLTIAGA